MPAVTRENAEEISHQICNDSSENISIKGMEVCSSYSPRLQLRQCKAVSPVVSASVPSCAITSSDGIPSNKEWSGIPQEQRKASDMKDQTVKPPTKSMAKGAMESSATSEKPNVVHMEMDQDFSGLTLQENKLKDFITPLATETKLPITEDGKVHEDSIKETSQNLSGIRQEHISQEIQKLDQMPSKQVQEATVDLRRTVQGMTDISAKETVDKGSETPELALEAESPEKSAEVPKVPYSARENIPPLVPDTIKISDKIENRDIPDVRLCADKKSSTEVEPESLEAEYSRKDIEQDYVGGKSDSVCEQDEIHHEVIDEQVKCPEERRVSTDRKNIFSTQEIIEGLPDERASNTDPSYVSKAPHTDYDGGKQVRKEVDDYLGTGKSNMTENKDIEEVDAEQTDITVPSSVKITDSSSKSEVDTSGVNIRYTGVDKESDITFPYVTTPTSQRRGLSGGSQRLTRDQRPPPLDVSHLMLDDDDDDDDDVAGDESYIVTEPIDDRKPHVLHRNGYGIAHVNSSPDILSEDSNPLIAKRNIGQTDPLTSPKRRPIFHIESEDDDLLDFTRGTNVENRGDIDATQYIKGKTALDIENEIKSEELMLGEEEEETAFKQKELQENVLQSVGDNVLSNEKTEKTEKEMKEEKGDSLDLTGLISFSESMHPIGTDLEEVGSEKVDENGQEEVRDGQTQDKQEKKLRRVERRFERMASETLESDAAEGTSTPEVEQRREAEFQRIISQLSTEEVANCQKEYSQLWDEGGLTPSEEWDSHDPDTPSCELDEHSAPNQDEISAVGREQQHSLHQEAPNRDSVSCRLPLHDVSIDDDEAEIDLHEHDWRFQRHHPAEPEDEATQSPPGTARSPIQTTDRRVVDGDSTTTVITTTTTTTVPVPSQETAVTEKGAADVEKESKAK